MTLHEYTNRGRLFDVEPTFNDIMGWEMTRSLHSVVLDMNRLTFGDDLTIPKKQPSEIKYFTAADQLRLDVQCDICPASTDLGSDEYGCALDCFLDRGHEGAHYDAYLRLEWTQR